MAGDGGMGGTRGSGALRVLLFNIVGGGSVMRVERVLVKVGRA